MNKIVVEEASTGVARWSMVAGNNTTLATSPWHVNVKAAQQSAAKIRDTMFPQPQLTVRRWKNNARPRN